MSNIPASAVATRAKTTKTRRTAVHFENMGSSSSPARRLDSKNSVVEYSTGTQSECQLLSVIIPRNKPPVNSPKNPAKQPQNHTSTFLKCLIWATPLSLSNVSETISTCHSLSGGYLR